jgi:transglutaminase-like putative cysteine protease
MLLRISHTTSFRYEKPAYQSQNELRMRPLDWRRQRCLEFELAIEPSGSVFEFTDYYGNHTHSISIYQPHDTLTVTTRAIVERDPEPIEEGERLNFGEFLVHDNERVNREFDYLSASHHVPFSGSLRKFFWMARPDPDEDVAAYTDRVVKFIRDQFSYEPGVTVVHSTADEILRVGGGVCQDFAHLTLGILRLAGVPSRYVSGYLAPPPGSPAVEQIGAQASHAWVEAELPGLGWVGFDPTHGCRADERHIRVAIGRDYADVPPLRGVYRSQGVKQVMSVDLTIEPISSEQVASQKQLQQQ